MGSSNTCPMGHSSDHWHIKPAEEETSVPTKVQLFNRARSAIWTVLAILDSFTRVAVRSSDVQVCLVDDSSGVCWWVRSMGVGMCVGG